MQEQSILDADGVTRRYAYDDFSGTLYVRDAASFAQDPGRPYRPIYAAKKPDLRVLGGVHAEMWRDPAAADQAIALIAPQIGWRSAH